MKFLSNSVKKIKTITTYRKNLAKQIESQDTLLNFTKIHGSCYFCQSTKCSYGVILEYSIINPNNFRIFQVDCNNCFWLFC